MQQYLTQSNKTTIVTSKKPIVVCFYLEVLHLIALQGEMELEFTKNVKKNKIPTY
jgi:hypothetical protein